VGTTRENFLDVVQPWLSSPWPLKKAYLWLDFGDAPADLPHLRPGVELGDPPLDAADAGRVLREERQFEVYAAEYEAAQPAFVVFRMTWHPNWKVTIDGKPEKTMMLSPGVLGVRTPPGKHQIICRYQPGMEKAALLISGILVATAIAAFSGGRGKRTRAIKLPATS
jgi:hypothetical protein